jgi:hypothetical protein
VSSAKCLGSNIGVHTTRVNAILTDIATVADAPMPEERTHTKERAKDLYLAVMFLVNSNKKWYGVLIQDIENEYTRGLDTYPISLRAAYDYIVNYHTSRNANTDIDEGGVAFYTRDHDDDSGHGPKVGIHEAQVS